MKLILEIVILLFTLTSIGIYISTACKNDIILTAAFLVNVIAVWLGIYNVWTPSFIVAPLSIYLSCVTILYDGIIVDSDPPDKKYFDKINWGLVLLGIFLFGKVLQEKSFNNPDFIWIIPVITLSVFTFVLQRLANNQHKKLFSYLGTISFILWIVALFIHPLIAHQRIDFDSIDTSIRLNGGFFLFLAMFFLGNYGKLGLLDNKNVHRNVFFTFIVIYSLSISARYPEFTSLLKTLPFDDKLPLISSIFFIGFPIFVKRYLEICNVYS